MSRLFFIDGTNLVRTAYGYGGPAHAAQEAADTDRLAVIFCRLCENIGPEIEVELFFDGAFRTIGGLRPDNFRVSFTRELPADDIILDRVRARKWARGGPTTVVTADVDLGELTAAEGVKWMRFGRGSTPESVARKIGGRLF